VTGRSRLGKWSPALTANERTRCPAQQTRTRSDHGHELGHFFPNSLSHLPSPHYILPLARRLPLRVTCLAAQGELCIRVRSSMPALPSPTFPPPRQDPGGNHGRHLSAPNHFVPKTGAISKSFFGFYLFFGTSGGAQPAIVASSYAVQYVFRLRSASCPAGPLADRRLPDLGRIWTGTAAWSRSRATATTASMGWQHRFG